MLPLVSDLFCSSCGLWGDLTLPVFIIVRRGKLPPNYMVVTIILKLRNSQERLIDLPSLWSSVSTQVVRLCSAVVASWNRCSLLLSFSARKAFGFFLWERSVGYQTSPGNERPTINQLTERLQHQTKPESAQFSWNKLHNAPPVLVQPLTVTVVPTVVSFIGPVLWLKLTNQKQPIYFRCQQFSACV